jgi:hypothetical protein
MALSLGLTRSCIVLAGWVVSGVGEEVEVRCGVRGTQVPTTHALRALRETRSSGLWCLRQNRQSMFSGTASGNASLKSISDPKNRSILAHCRSYHVGDDADGFKPKPPNQLQSQSHSRPGMPRHR